MTGMGRPKHVDWRGLGWLALLIIVLLMVALTGKYG